MIEMPNPFVTNSADVVMPPAYEPDMDALYDAIVPPEPPPIFLRSPSQAFMRALFELTH
jgi:hypothetical protein